MYYSWDLTKPKIIMSQCKIFLLGYLYFFATQAVDDENKEREFNLVKICCLCSPL